MKSALNMSLKKRKGKKLGVVLLPIPTRKAPESLDALCQDFRAETVGDQAASNCSLSLFSFLFAIWDSLGASRTRID